MGSSLSLFPSPRSVPREAPILKLQGVPVPTGEENMDLLLTVKGQLYRYDQEGGTWNDRGLDTLKLLRDKETGEVLLVVRHSKTLRICVNHLVLPSINVQEHHENNKVCVWSATDFSDGEPKLEIFSIRFDSLDDSKLFRHMIEKIIDPIFKLQGVTVTPGEENMDVLLHMKGELYRFDKEGCDWKDMVVGTVKLLRHKETGKVLLVMRQENTLKIHANHLVLPTIKFREHLENKNICVWHASDFTDGEPKVETFCFCFATVENCKQFRDKIEKITESLEENMDALLNAVPKRRKRGMIGKVDIIYGDFSHPHLRKRFPSSKILSSLGLAQRPTGADFYM